KPTTRSACVGAAPSPRMELRSAQKPKAFAPGARLLRKAVSPHQACVGAAPSPRLELRSAQKPKAFAPGGGAPTQSGQPAPGLCRSGALAAMVPRRAQGDSIRPGAGLLRKTISRDCGRGG